MSRRKATSLASDRGSAQAQAAPEGGLARGGAGAFEGGPASTPGRQLVKTAAIYARVSTDRQEKEETVQSQLDALRRAAEERADEVPPEYVFVDEGQSGARLDRPALDRLRDLAMEGAFEVVLIYAPDRLAREYAYQVVVLDELKRAGCEVVFLNHAFGKSPEEQMLLQIQGVFAQYERALIQERMRRGRLFAARQGRVNWGIGPYGYRYLRKTDSTPPLLVVNETEAEVVRQMYRWLVEEQISTESITRRLNERGVPTRKGGLRGWRQSTVADILRKSMNKGEAYYNRTMQVDAKQPHGPRGFKDLRPGNRRGQAFRPKEDWIPVRVPAIVDAETWSLAQEQLARNRERAKRNNKRHDYLLRGLLVCGRCGRRMIGGWHGDGGQYRCPLRFPRFAPWSCDGRVVAAPRIEALVWEQVETLLSDPELLKARYQEGNGDPAIDVREEHERERIERKLQGLSREVQRLIDAYQAEAIEIQELTERRTRIEEHARMLKARVREVQDQRADREQELRLLEGLEAFCESVRGAMEQPSFEVKRKVLQLVVDRVVVEESRVVVQHVVPAGPVRLQTDPQAAEGALGPARDRATRPRVPTGPRCCRKGSSSRGWSCAPGGTQRGA